MRPTLFIFIASLLVLCSSCREDQLKEVPLEFSYYPVAIGDETIYSVDSIVYNDFTMSVDTYQYRLRERVVSVEEENGATNYRVNIAEDVGGVWRQKRSLEVSLEASYIDRIEENQRVTILSFPVSERQTWLGRGRTDTDNDWVFRYENIGSPRSFGGEQFATTILVKQDSTQNLIQDIYSYEIYAKGVGLVQKYSKDIETQMSVKRGLIRQLTIESYTRN